MYAFGSDRSYSSLIYRSIWLQETCPLAAASSEEPIITDRADEGTSSCGLSTRNKANSKTSGAMAPNDNETQPLIRRFGRSGPVRSSNVFDAGNV